MRVLFVHPSALMYSELFLRLEPLGVESVAATARRAGHSVRVLDLQVFSHADLARELADFRPDAVGFGLNYLANIPEVIDLARAIKRRLPDCFVFAGGHSLSFIADHVLRQAEGAIDAVVRGEGETAVGPLLAACRDGGPLHDLPWRGHPGRSWRRPADARLARRHPAGAGAHEAAEAVLHRDARPLRFHRVHPRLPLGLLVLLGLDLLRPLLSPGVARGRGGGDGGHR